MKVRTGAEHYFEKRLQDPIYRDAHKRATATVRAIDSLVYALDRARRQQHLSKAELARRVGVDPASMRRFFSTDAPNPTAHWLIQVALALGYRVNLEQDEVWASKSGRQRHTVGTASGQG
jgi:hypothetical protein